MIFDWVILNIIVEEIAKLPTNNSLVNPWVDFGSMTKLPTLPHL